MNEPLTRIIVVGAKGRMGAALLGCATRAPGIEVAGQIDLGDDLRRVIQGGDVVIDFSVHDNTAACARICAQHHKAMVIGVTGHLESERQELAALSKEVPMVWASNFSTGVNVLFWLTRRAAEVLGPGYDLEIVEMHHRLKKDAPSGTASTLAQILAEVRRQEAGPVLRHGRQGLIGERGSEEIGIHALRGGDVVGEHTVIFAGMGERVELSHKASSRESFALGALRAARWIVGKPPAIYDMQQVLGLR